MAEDFKARFHSSDEIDRFRNTVACKRVVQSPRICKVLSPTPFANVGFYFPYREDACLLCFRGSASGFNIPVSIEVCGSLISIKSSEVVRGSFG